MMLPENLTVDLLDGNATTLALYKNPAQTILPSIVEEGLNLLCVGVDQALKLLTPEMNLIRKIPVISRTSTIIASKKKPFLNLTLAIARAKIPILFG